MGFMDTINAMTVNNTEGSTVNPQVNKIELLPHNQELYDMVVEKINAGEKSIFYSEGTGLGKSFIFMRLVQDFFADKKVLYIVPKIAIWDNLTHYEDFKKIENNVDMVTFTKFNTYPYDEEYCTKYDAVFVDECHHMLSDIQGKNVKQLLDSMTSWDKFAFGMTATPEVNGVYVDEEMFDISCYGLDMYQAIEKGIFPKMDIAIGIKEDLDIPDNLREKFSVTGTQTLLDRVLHDYRHVTHWLAYFTTQEELEQNESELRKLFPDYKILKIYQGCGDSSVIEEFENSIAPVILMSVSMFLEGMHLKNVGGVLLYRNIQKSHTYAQILGRLCVIGQKYTPVMVDITGSIINIKQFYIPKSSRASEEQRKKYERKDIFDVTSKSYMLIEYFEQLLFSANIRWTKEELDVISNYYLIEGENIVDRLPNRTLLAIQIQARKMGLRSDIYWTAEQESILRTNAGKVRKEHIASLVGKSVNSVVGYAHKLGISLKVSIFTKEEEDYIVKLYEEGMSISDIADKFKERCSFNPILTILKNRGVYTPIRSRWTDEQVSILKDIYPSLKTNWSKYTEHIPEHPAPDIRAKALRLGIIKDNGRKCWTEEEDFIMKEYYPLGVSEALKRLPDRTQHAVLSRAKQLGIEVKQLFTEEEDALLINLYTKEGRAILSRFPGRTWKQVVNRVSTLRRRGISIK